MPFIPPIDLPEIKKPAIGPDTRWQPFSLVDRIACVLADQRAYPLWAMQGAVAITTIEQPPAKSIPVFNPAGIMCQGLSFDPQPKSTRSGWGWGRGAWNRAGVRPCGYAFLHEGLTGKYPPFLAFASNADSMRFVVQQCFEDGGDKYDGDDYCQHWFGIAQDNALYSNTRKMFNAKFAMVQGIWPKPGNIPGWRDVGASA